MVSCNTEKFLIFLAVRASSLLSSCLHYTVNCRVSSSGFIIPLNKFLKSLDHSYLVGMRFRMRFETEDTGEKRFSLLVLLAFNCLLIKHLSRTSFGQVHWINCGNE